MVSKNGIIYLSFPCSKKSRIEYNSQRVLSLKESKMIFKEKNLVIEKFSYVDDFGNLVKRLQEYKDGKFDVLEKASDTVRILDVM